jgi:hypothetical protein
LQPPFYEGVFKPKINIMAQVNVNTPYTKCLLRKEFTGLDENLEGYLFGAKSLINYPLLFHFQGSNGAIFWNVSINYFCWKEDYDPLNKDEETRLQMLESWDCQSNAITATCFKFLEHKMVDVFCRDKKWRRGIYIFTLDDYEGDPNEINVGHSNSLDSKCFHFIYLDDGNICLQPNNLIRWHNADHIIPFDLKNPPKIKIAKDLILSENIDRTYGNSPYYFYGNDDISTKSEEEDINNNN